MGESPQVELEGPACELQNCLWKTVAVRMENAYIRLKKGILSPSLNQDFPFHSYILFENMQQHPSKPALDISRSYQGLQPSLQPHNFVSVQEAGQRGKAQANTIQVASNSHKEEQLDSTTLKMNARPSEDNVISCDAEDIGNHQKNTDVISHSAENSSENETTEVGVLQSKRRCLKIVLVLTVVSLLTIGFIISSYHCYPPLFDHCKARPSPLVALVVNRTFDSNTCFHLNYSTHLRSDNQGNKTQSRVNNSLYLCVKSVFQNKDLEFVGYLKKTSEENLEVTPPKIEFSFNEVGLQRFLFKENDVTEDNSTQTKDPTPTKTVSPKKSSQNQTVKAENNDTKIDESESIPNETQTTEVSEMNTTMFRVSVFRNGTIKRIEFDRQEDNETIGELPKYLKLFFPKLDQHLYASQSRLLQQTNSTDSDANSTQTLNQPEDDDGETQDNSTESYSVKKKQDGEVTLDSQKIVNPKKNDSVNSKEESKEESKFDKNNNLISAKLVGSANIKSKDEKENQDYKVLSLNVSLELKQNMTMQVVFTYRNLTAAHISDFQSYFVVEVVEKNTSLNFTEQELKEYLLDSKEESDNDTNATRLLARTSSTWVRLLTQYKWVRLLRTNILGIQIMADSYTYIYISVRKSGGNKYPYLYTSTFLRLKIGKYTRYQYVTSMYRELQSLSSTFTLNKIGSYVNLYKSSFLSKVKSLTSKNQQLEINKSYTSKTTKLIESAEDLYKKLGKAFEKCESGDREKRDLGYLRKSISEISYSVSKRIRFIKGMQEDIQSAFKKIQKLEMGSKNSSLKSIQDNYKDLTEVIDQISEEMNQLKYIKYNRFSSKYSEINKMIRSIYGDYKDLESLKDKAKSQIIQFIASFKGFMEDDFVQKFITLLESKSALESNPRKSDTQKTVLFKKSEKFKRISLYRLNSRVVTSFGCFNMVVSYINWNFDYNVEIGIQNYRDLYANIQYNTRLSMSFNYNYNMVTKRIGVYASGQLLSAKTQAQFKGKNYLPMIIPKQLSSLSQFSNLNNFVLSYYLYSQPYSTLFSFGIHQNYRYSYRVYYKVTHCRRFAFWKKCWSERKYRTYTRWAYRKHPYTRRVNSSWKRRVTSQVLLRTKH